MKSRGLALISTLLLALNMQAQPATGEYNVDFAGFDVQVFNLEPTIVTFIGDVPHDLSLELLPSGTITGEIWAYQEDSESFIEVTGTAGGKLSVVNSALRITLSASAAITGSDFGDPITGSESLKFQCIADPILGIVTGAQKAKVCLSGYGCASMVEPIFLEAYEVIAGTGEWTLSLNVTNDTGTITGTARATIANGASADFTARGKYSPSSGLTTFQLKGVNAAKGAKLQLTADSGMNVRSIRGKMFGQIVDRVSD